MTNEQANDTAASEPVKVDTGTQADSTQEQTEQQVPLSALQAERQKRQEHEAEIRYLREQNNNLTAQKTVVEPSTSDDDEDFVNKRDLKNFQEKLTKEEFASMKRSIAEDTFKEVNPEAMKMINTHLKDIIEKKPWLADSIATAPNRYARAYEIVQDYAPMVTAKKQSSDDAKRIVENSKKPGSPVSVAKSAQLSGADYLKSIAGKAEFREYRKSVRQG